MTTITETREFLKTKGCALVPNDNAAAKWKVRLKATGDFQDVATLEEAASVGESLWSDHETAKRAKAEAERKIRDQREAEREAARIAERERRVSKRRELLAAIVIRAESLKSDESKEASIFRSLAYSLERAVQMTDEFRADFEADPLYSLEWAARAIEQAAVESVYAGVLGSIAERLDAGKREEILPSLRDSARRQVLRLAANPPHSSSASSNLCEQYKGAVWAKIVEILEWEGVR